MAGDEHTLQGLKRVVGEMVAEAKDAKATAEELKRQLNVINVPHTALDAVKLDLTEELTEEIMFLLKGNGHEITDPERSGILELIRRKINKPL